MSSSSLLSLLLLSLLCMIARAWISQRSASRLLALRTFSFNVGDTVVVNNDVQGTVQASSGRGWYSVQLGSELVKCRSTQLQKYGTMAETRDTNNQTDIFVDNQQYDANQQDANQVVNVPVIVLEEPQHMRPYAATSFTNSVDNMPPPPTMYNLDAALEYIQQHKSQDSNINSIDDAYMQQVANHASIDKWVIFTDLHCCPANLDTSLQVLDTVHKLAIEHDAGILFLGDWWHYRGTLRVDCLNAVLEALASWTVPMVMIPGNHDQVTLGGHHHSLTPLLQAYRVKTREQPTTNTTSTTSSSNSSTTVPGPLIFSFPTLFKKALFIPHIRDTAVLESIVQSPLAKSTDAIFCHVDVFGAFHNDYFRSDSGIDPSYFPAEIPIYSGHFHKPHQVIAENVCIDYLGSPFEVSLAEAQQNKSLAIVDASRNWQVLQRIPINIGRRHYPVASIEDFKSLSIHDDTATVDHNAAASSQDNNSTVAPRIKSGDRVVVSLPKDVLDTLQRSSNDPFHSHVELLRSVGVTVEVRQNSVNNVLPRSNDTSVQKVAEAAVEVWSPEAIWLNFLQEQVKRAVYTEKRAAEFQKAGLDILTNLQENNNFEDPTANSATFVDFTNISVEGFGPFRYCSTYPLQQRGLVLLRGSNKDGGTDSNGSGKTSLAMSALWALTGSLDPRPLQDAKVADLVNDDSIAAKVTLRGTVNGKNFIISRTKTSSKGALTFIVDGQDLTTQSVKETQAVIEEKLHVNPTLLARTVFHSQHGGSKLLEAHDAKFKEELALVVPLEIWQAAVSVARKNNKSAKESIAQIEGMIKVRMDDLEKQRARQKEADENVQQKTSIYEQSKNDYDATATLLSTQADHSAELHQLEDQYSVATAVLKTLEAERKLQEVERRIELEQIEAKVAELARIVDEVRNEALGAQRKVDKCAMEADIAGKKIAELEKTWQVDVASAEFDLSLLPQACPTCGQTIDNSTSSDASLHSSHDTSINLTNTFAVAIDERLKSSQQLDTATAELEMSEKNLGNAISDHQQIQQIREERLSYWKATFDDLDARITEARGNCNTLSQQITSKMKDMQARNQASNLYSILESREELLRDSERYRDSLMLDITETERLIEDYGIKKDEEQCVSVVMSELSEALGQRGVPTFLMQNAIAMLEDSCQKYLAELSDGSLQLKLSLDDSDRILRRAFVRGPTGEYQERPLASLSGGQWRRCSIALDISFVELVGRLNGFRSSLLIMDEPMTHLDRSGRTDVGRLLKTILQSNATITTGSGLGISTVICILQDLAAEELEEAFDHIDEVVKEKGESTVKVDERVA